MKKLIMSFVLLLILAACRERSKDGKVMDTTTSGTITIAVDESLKPLMEAEVDAFEHIYKNAKVNVIYTSEQDAIGILLKDSARLAVITRPLMSGEEQLLKDRQLSVNPVKVAKNGVALIINRNNPDSTMTVAQLKDILSGKVNHWNDRKKSARQIQVVFDQPNSGIVRFFTDSLQVALLLPSNCFALNSNAAVVDYVTQQQNALGVIDVSWISDRDDSVAHDFRKSIRVVAVGTEADFVKPYQAYIANKEYPLLRNVYIVSREARAGLGSGLTAFVAGDKGQRIVLKSGLVPATMPVRLVHVSHEPIN